MLKGSIFGVEPIVPALGLPGDGLVVTPADKISLMCFQFNSKQCREQFITPESCFPQPGAALWPSALLSFDVYFSILTHEELFGCVFYKRVADIIAPIFSVTT